jgi:hypothetical protein
MSLEQGIKIGAAQYDIWQTIVSLPLKRTVFHYKFLVARGDTTAF